MKAKYTQDAVLCLANVAQEVGQILVPYLCCLVSVKVEDALRIGGDC